MTKKSTATIEGYIEEASPEARPHLHQLYAILKSVAPDGTGAIKWGVPVFWERRMLFGFAAYKAHVSFGPGEAAMKRFSRELEKYKTGKGTMQIPYDQPIPEDLIRRIAEYCVTDEGENDA